MTNLKNNLFYYATKELSQDAFICWLCSFALEGADSTDEELVRCGKNFVCEFIKRGIETENADSSDVLLTKVEKQVGNIDVLLTVEYDGEVYKIIIEDKVNSSEHDNQLQRYKNSITDHNTKVIGIYFKTGFQSDYSKVYEAGYKVFNRTDMLELLRDCKSDNAILNDFRNYWEDFESIAKSYKTEPIEKWSDWQTVNGFYDEMKSLLEEKEGGWAGYSFVSNRSGGFWGLWYGESGYDIINIDSFSAGLYLQVETKWNDDSGRYDVKICIKLENKSSNEQDDRLWRLRELIVESLTRYGFERPSRLGWGQHMTVGSYKMSCNTYEELKGSIFSSLDDFRNLFLATKDKMMEM